MTLTHHPVRLFRLSCGCLRAYPMMPAGTAHEVLCTRCRVAAVTVTAYPERACGATAWARVSERRILVSCTRARGGCGRSHYDELAGAAFAVVPYRLERGRA